jgi:hypothetical protein
MNILFLPTLAQEFDNPNHPRQRYFLTEKGERFKKATIENNKKQE